LVGALIQRKNDKTWHRIRWYNELTGELDVLRLFDFNKMLLADGNQYDRTSLTSYDFFDRFLVVDPKAALGI